MSEKTKIHYTRPSITQLEEKYATDAAANGWGAKCYDYIFRFEDVFKKHLGVKHVIATSSCTGAIHMGLSALGIGPGDEVILADTNWIASAAPITYLGAKPVFVDIMPDTWCINPKLAEKAITPRTKAIIAVHLYGNLCDMDALLDIGKRHGISILEDSAEAIGSVYKGNKAGSMGKFGTFSFHGTKTITTGEGGMFVTNDDDLFEHVLTLSNHGRERGQTKQFWPDRVGFKYKMSNIQAAIGCAQMERIDELIGAKRRVFLNYKKELEKIDGLQLNPEHQDTVNGYWMPNVVLDPSLNISHKYMFQAFKAENIDARVFFHPLSSLPMFTDKPENTIAWDLPNRSINLPSYHDLAIEEQYRVVSVITTLLEMKIKTTR